MLELKINVSDVDYDAVIRILGGSEKVGSAFSLLTGMLPDSMKEEFAAGLINSNTEMIESLLEEAALEKGVRLNLSGVKAAVVDRN